MGCDIHLYTEKKVQTRDGDDAWFCCDYFMHNESYICGYAKEDELNHVGIYDNRNYLLFGILANVRNDEYIPIAAPRGLPNDVSDIVKQAADDWIGDGHTHSWLTAGEIFKYYNRNKVDCRIKQAMKPLVKAIKRKMCEQFWIRTEDKEIKKQRLKQFEDSFRIVFWFDN